MAGSSGRQPSQPTALLDLRHGGPGASRAVIVGHGFERFDAPRDRHGHGLSQTLGTDLRERIVCQLQIQRHPTLTEQTIAAIHAEHGHLQLGHMPLGSRVNCTRDTLMVTSTVVAVPEICFAVACTCRSSTPPGN